MMWMPHSFGRLILLSSKFELSKTFEVKVSRMRQRCNEYNVATNCDDQKDTK